MIWKDKEIKTIGDLMTYGIDKCKTPEEAQEFMKAYRAECQYADENIGYLSGYYDSKNMQRIQEWFGVSHPIFGNPIPTFEKAFEAGKKIAKGE